MLLDVPDASLLVSQPLGGIVSAQLLDELPRPSGDVPGEVDGVDALQDDVVRLHGVRAGEGGSTYCIKKGKGDSISMIFVTRFSCQRTREKLEHEHPERPVVRADIVALVEDDLGGDVLGRAAESPGLASDL